MVVPVETYIPPKRDPVVDGKNPAAVIIPKIITEKMLMLLFLAGFPNISAINIKRAAAISSNSCRINKKVPRLILYNYPNHLKH
jgi:hypothetical protein